MVRFVACSLVCAALLCVGCKSEPPKSGASNKPVSRADVKPPPALKPAARHGVSGAARLHDIEGLFLLYGVIHHKMPEKLDELKNLPGETIPDFICPVSNLPYIYDPVGKPPPSGNGLVILYDAAPTHGDIRLCIVMEQNTSGAFVPKVIALPEKFFKEMLKAK